MRSVPHRSRAAIRSGTSRTWRARSTQARYYLPDAEEGRRETLVTSVLDAEPVQCLRVGGTAVADRCYRPPSLGGVFIALTFHWWIARARLSASARSPPILWWLWTGTGEIPEKQTKESAAA